MNDINYTRSKKRSQQKINRPENMAFTVFCWIFMIGSWLLLITPFLIWLTYWDNSTNQLKAIIAFIVGAGCYLIHFILQLCSLCSTFSCFHIQESFQKIMLSFFKDRPTYTLSLECYHYESEEEEYVDEEGNTQTRTHTYKVHSFNGKKNIEYYSCRDVSGLLEIDIKEEDAENIEYIMLKTDYDITFYDDNSLSDFEKAKKDFKNAHNDSYVECDEKITFNLLKKNEIYIFKLNKNKNSCSIYGCFFLY